MGKNELIHFQCGEKILRLKRLLMTPDAFWINPDSLRQSQASLIGLIAHDCLPGETEQKSRRIIDKRNFERKLKVEMGGLIRILFLKKNSNKNQAQISKWTNSNLKFCSSFYVKISNWNSFYGESKIVNKITLFSPKSIIFQQNHFIFTQIDYFSTKSLCFHHRKLFQLLIHNLYK